MGDLRAAGRLLMVLGTVFVLLGCGFSVSTIGLVHGALRTVATVTGNTRTVMLNGSVAYRPQFQFTTPDGRMRKGEADAGSHTEGYVPGDRIHVIYPPDDPYSAQLDSFQSLWLMPAAFCGVGVTLALTGWLVRAIGIRREYAWLGGA